MSANDGNPGPAGPQITEFPEDRNTAVIRLDIPRSEMPKIFGPAVHEVLEALKAQGLQPRSGSFAHHTSMSPDRFVFELGFVVDGVVQATGRVVPSTWPRGKAFMTTLEGDYSGLPDAWAKFDAWAREQGVKLAPDVWESYRVFPNGANTTADLRTDLYIPLA